MFGDRRCKSMIELPTGWPMEEDPRKIVTWPMTPEGYKELSEEMTHRPKFTPEDAYGETIEKKGEGTQADFNNVDFNAALNRKKGNMLDE